MEAPRSDPFVEWYEAWRAQQTERREAEAKDLRLMQREIRWMTYFLVGWSVAAGVAGLGAIAILYVL